MTIATVVDLADQIVWAIDIIGAAVLDSEQLSQHRHRVDRDDMDVESTLAVPAIHVVVEHFGNVPGPLRAERLGRVCTSTAESGTTD